MSLLENNICLGDWRRWWYDRSLWGSSVWVCVCVLVCNMCRDESAEQWQWETTEVAEQTHHRDNRTATATATATTLRATTTPHTCEGRACLTTPTHTLRTADCVCMYACVCAWLCLCVTVRDCVWLCVRDCVWLCVTVCEWVCGCWVCVMTVCVTMGEWLCVTHYLPASLTQHLHGGGVGLLNAFFGITF